MASAVVVLLSIGGLSMLGLLARLGYPSLGWSFVAVLGVVAVAVVVQVIRRARAGAAPARSGRTYLLLGGLCTVLWLMALVLALTTDAGIGADVLALLLVPCVTFTAAGFAQQRS
jgi:hypothetical protein